MLADSGVFGADLLVWLVLALGAAMVVGYGMALLRPPPAPKGRGKVAGKSAPGKSQGGRRPAGKPAKAVQGRGGARASAKGGSGRQLQEAPRGRSVVMIGIGAIATIWSLATLIKH